MLLSGIYAFIIEDVTLTSNTIEMGGSVVTSDVWMPKKMLVQEIIYRGIFFPCFMLRDIIEIKGNSLPPHHWVHQVIENIKHYP